MTKEKLRGILNDLRLLRERATEPKVYVLARNADGSVLHEGASYPSLEEAKAKLRVTEKDLMIFISNDEVEIDGTR